MSLRLQQLVDEGLREDEALRITTTVDCSVEPSRTKQAFAQEADINFLMDRYMRTGVFPQVEDMGGPQAQFGDFSEGIDFMEAMSRVQAASDSFAGLPADVRARFHNDPAELLDFVSQDGNRAEALRLGLLEDKRAQAARLERSRAEDVKARDLDAAERRGREAGRADRGTSST